MNDFANAMRMERAATGNYGADIDDTERFCPICGQASPDYVYEDKDGDIIGCTECLTKKDIYGYFDDEWERKR